jgi:hypothetical protein
MSTTRQDNINLIVDRINVTAREETAVLELRAMLYGSQAKSIEFLINAKIDGVLCIHVLDVNGPGERAALTAFLSNLSLILKTRGELLDNELIKVVSA